MLRSMLFAAVAFACLSASQVHADPPEPYYDLGEIQYDTSTDSKQAQLWFDRGLGMCLGFNHEEAVRCFERALQADAEFPMAWWGIAYALGPNINNPLNEVHQVAQASLAARMADLYADQANDTERGLIDAIKQRYVLPVPEDRTPQNKAYSNAMRKLHEQHPEDALITMLFADSLMMLHPWKLWSPDGTPAPVTSELVALLEAGLDQWPDHPGLCHLYIHTMEASPTPEKALPAAERLQDMVPGSGHLVHMPSHIYVLVGDYEMVIATNEHAIAVDEEFLEAEGPYNFYTLYRVHNYHFLVYGAMFDGQRDLAMQAARDLVKTIPEDYLKAQTDFLDAFIPTPLHVMVRFGMWDEILDEPEAPEYLPVTRAIRRYARAVAYAATGRVDEAEAEHQAFLDEKARVPESSFLFQNASLDILGVAEKMIAGEIAYRRGEFDEAFDHLREAVQRDDGLNYDEPWGWMQPARHALGALLLEQGHFDEAADVYRADLDRHPNNPWALHGLAECLDHQGRSEAAGMLRQQLTTATKRADVKIDRSCFCRTGDPTESQ
ncbi:MAG: tetratricopeptide repeat protein [Planctomycetaceae bacterium]|nr:tetratricopeptide repeat protein [Planctomycetaceae bacterium]